MCIAFTCLPRCCSMIHCVAELFALFTFTLVELHRNRLSLVYGKQQTNCSCLVSLSTWYLHLHRGSAHEQFHATASPLHYPSDDPQMQ